MSRPESIDDLPSYYRSDEAVANIHLHKVKFGTETINAYKLVAELAQEFKTLGFTVDFDASQLEVTRAKTDEELNRLLGSQQRSWDLAEEAYNQGLIDPTLFSAGHAYKRSWADSHAVDEKLPRIKWVDPESEADCGDND